MFRRLSKIGETMIASELPVLHLGCRALQSGWPRLIFMWLVNSFFERLQPLVHQRMKEDSLISEPASSDDQRIDASGSH